jgi:predicted chitinase
MLTSRSGVEGPDLEQTIRIIEIEGFGATVTPEGNGRYTVEATPLKPEGELGQRDVDEFDEGADVTVDARTPADPQVRGVPEPSQPVAPAASSPVEPVPSEAAAHVTPPAASAPSDSAAGTPVLICIAREGLNLRSGPGTQYGVLRLLPFGAEVHAIKHDGDWVMVDQVGDGAADGYVLGAFLRQGGAVPLTAAPAPAAAAKAIAATSTSTSTFKPLDVPTLQTIMNRCAGVPIHSKLDLNQVVYALNKSMLLANANTLVREVAFLSQAVIETDYFRTFAEYGKGAGKDYYPFYGRGIHQLTWEQTYAACSQAVFHDARLIQNPNLITSDIEVNAKATAWYWRDYKPFNSLADARNIDEIIHRLSGGRITSPNPNVRKSVMLRRGYYKTIGAILGLT